MNFSVPLNWFQIAVGYPVSVEEIEKHVGDLGFDIQIHDSDYREPLIVIAKVLATRTHPNAERLKLCQVDDGSGHLIEIVCGCPSVSSGMLVPFAKVDAKLPKVTIKESVIRGIDSKGMLCSRSDLGLEAHSSGLWRLDDDLNLGDSLYASLGYDSPVLVFEVTANRRDCLSLEGIAREWCALVKHQSVDIEHKSFLDHVPSASSEMISMPEAALSATWVQLKLDQPLVLPELLLQRLHLLGLYSDDPILNLQRIAEVEFGLPMHVYSNVQPQAWHVDTLTTDYDLNALDGETYHLKKGDVVVLSDGKVVSLAGMIGGMDSRYQTGAQDIWIEALEVDADTVADTKKRLGINTTAAMRTSRGVAGGLAHHTMAGFLSYILCCDGVSVVSAVYTSSDRTVQSVKMNRADVINILGFDPKQQLEQSLDILCFKYHSLDDVQFDIDIPWYRSDIEKSCDVVEEIIRVIGYDALQECMPDLPVTTMIIDSKRDRMDHYLSSVGFDEVISYSFIEPSWDKHMGMNDGESIHLANPISSELSVMRRSLMPGLLKTSHHRYNNQRPWSMLFEWGRSYKILQGNICESEVLALYLSGDRFNESPLDIARSMDYYDLLQYVKSIFISSGMDLMVRKNTNISEIFHPNSTASLWVENKCVGTIGMIHPRLSEGFPHAYYAEIDADLLLSSSHVPVFTKFNRVPVVYRDLSLWCQNTLTYEEIDDCIRELSIKELKSWSLVDIYYAKGAIQRQSISLRLCLSGEQKSLKDTDVERVISHLMSNLSEKLLVELRKNENVNES